jgi:hypothetical protein
MIAIDELERIWKEAFVAETEKHHVKPDLEYAFSELDSEPKPVFTESRTPTPSQYEVLKIRKDAWMSSLTDLST